MPKKKRAATIEDPALEAAAQGLFRFARPEQAVALMARIKDQFILCKEQDNPETAGPTIRLWIRGFAVTPEEKEKGFRGHFARISIKKQEGNKFTLLAEKMPVELKFHPQKERPKFKHPNWGHPILRGIQKGKSYPTIEVARKELLRLHEEFPETTIPGTDKLHLMIYSRTEVPPIQKRTFRIAAEADGTFRITVSEQKKRPPGDMPILAGAEGGVDAPEASGGKYTSLVSLQRKRKKK